MNRSSPSQQLFTNLFNKHDAVMLLIEPESGDIVMVNAAASVFYGYDNNRLTSMKISDINKLPPEKVAEERRRVASRQLNHFEFPHQLANGDVRTVEVYSTPLVLDGRTLLYSIIHDVTDRKRAEQALLDSNTLLQKTLDSLNEAVFIVQTGTRRILDCNRMVELMFGYTRDEMIGASTACLHLNEEMSLRFGREMQKSYDEKGYYETVFIMKRKDGTTFDSEHSVTPIRDEGGTIASHVCVVRDVSERKRILEKLTKSQQELEKLNRLLEERISEAVAELRQKDQLMIQQSRQAALGEMIHNIAHQWRQPLNTLGLLLANMEDAHRFNELDAKLLLESTARGAKLIQKMSSTINDFSNFFRPDKEIVNFSAQNQLWQAVALVEPSFGNDDITLRVDATHDLHLTGFPNEYSQVLLNLLSNAKDAINASGVVNGQIVIRLARNGNLGCVTVCDNGGGIPADIIDRIFEPYFSTKEMGAGIGLYMSKTIIERNMRGSIEARNMGGGAEFTICLPLAKEPEMPDLPLHPDSQV